MARFNLAQFPSALAFAAAGSSLAAQGLFGVPASDPAGIARAGAGVAFGRSLEAASLNPALLATIQEHGGLFLAAGQEFQSAQDTLQSNQLINYSTDRNRLLPSFGAAWVVNKRLTVGLKADNPYLRHATLGSETTTRFLGDELSLEARRVEAQVAFAFRNDFSLGASVGLARINYASGAALRLAVPTDPTKPLGASNPSMGLMEQRVRQEGSATVPSASLGLRWAINSRWTLGASVQGSLTGDVKLRATFGERAPSYVSNDGLSSPPIGIATQGAVLKGLLQVKAGNEKIQLPMKAALGLRHRSSNNFTWEADLRFTDGANTQLPGPAFLQTPSGFVVNPAGEFQGQKSIGLSLMGEVALGNRWVLRGGLSIDQGLKADSEVEPLMGGARSAGFSAGAAYRIGRGEVSLGYQVRQSQDVDTRSLDGAWSLSGYRSTGTSSRIENSGHLYAIGYKVTF